MKQKRTRGMSLLEIMVVITLIGLVTAAIAVNVFGTKGDAEISFARTQANQLASAIDIYRLKHGAAPTVLASLTEPPPVITSLPADPWGNAYVYVNPGQKNPYGFDIVSRGPDGIEGTHDDVGNWQQ